MFPFFHRKAFSWFQIGCCVRIYMAFPWIASMYGGFTHERMNVTWQSSTHPIGAAQHISDHPPVQNLQEKTEEWPSWPVVHLSFGHMMNVDDIFFKTPSWRYKKQWLMECISKLWRLLELGFVMRPQKSNNCGQTSQASQGDHSAASLPGVNSDGCIHRSVVRNDVTLQVPQFSWACVIFVRVLTTINYDKLW